MIIGNSCLEMIKIPNHQSFSEIINQAKIMMQKFSDSSEEEKNSLVQEYRQAGQKVSFEVMDFIRTQTGQKPLLVCFSLAEPDSPEALNNLSSEKLATYLFYSIKWYLSVGKVNSNQIWAISFRNIDINKCINLVWLPDSNQVFFETMIRRCGENNNEEIRAIPKIILKGFSLKSQKWKSVEIKIDCTIWTNLVPWQRLIRFISLHNEYWLINRLKKEGCSEKEIREILKTFWGIFQKKLEILSIEKRFSSLLAEVLISVYYRGLRKKIKTITLPFTEEKILLLAKAVGCSRAQQQFLQNCWVEQKGNIGPVNPGYPQPAITWTEIAQATKEKFCSKWKVKNQKIYHQEEKEIKPIIMEFFEKRRTETKKKITEIVDYDALEQIISEIFGLCKILSRKEIIKLAKIFF